MVRVLSLFDGISCGRVAFERAGISVTEYHACEIDKSAIKISKTNFPDITNHGSVTTYSPNSVFDYVIGGSPCQGFSSAGKQKAFDDPRSSLFFEYVRILNEVRSRNPNVKFLLENVRMAKKHQDVISEALGVTPVCINSSTLSAQNRIRLYWCNWVVSQPNDKGVLLQDILESGWVDRDKSYCIDANYGKGSNPRRYFLRGSRQLVWVDKDTYDSLPYLPFIKIKSTEWDKIQFNSPTRGPQKPYRILSPTECERLQTLPDGYTCCVSKNDRYKAIGNGWTVDVITHILKESLV